MPSQKTKRWGDLDSTTDDAFDLLARGYVLRNPPSGGKPVPGGEQIVKDALRAVERVIRENKLSGMKLAEARL